MSLVLCMIEWVLRNDSFHRRFMLRFRWLNRQQTFVSRTPIQREFQTQEDPMRRRDFITSVGATSVCAYCSAAFGQPHRPRFVCDFTLANSSGGVVPRSFSLKGASRGKSKLTWSFDGVIKGVPKPDDTDTLTKAFELWRAATPTLQFFRVNSNADITISSGPVEPAPGGIVAASTRSDGGTITFNKDLIFHSNGPGGGRLLALAAH